MATTANDAAALGVMSANSRVHQWTGGLTQRALSARVGFLALLVGAVAWELAGRFMQISFLPPLSRVLAAAWNLTVSGAILDDLVSSLFGLWVGFLLAAAGGVLLGFAMGRYRKVEYFFDMYINAFLAAPKIVLVPILFALFGIGHAVQIAIVFLSAFFVIVVNTMAALRSVDDSFVEMARSFGASELQVVSRVLIPGSLPLTMAGLRLGMGRAVKGMINGEMFIAVFGLGGLLRTYGSRFDAENVFAVLLVVIVVALVCTGVVQAVERRVTRWTEQSG